MTLLVAVVLGFGLAQPGGYARLDEHVQAEMRRVSIPGLAYAIVQDGEVVHVRAFGIAGPDGRAMTTRTVLNTAADARSAGLDVADGYRLAFGVPVVADVPLPPGVVAAGLMFTTIEDMARYAAAFSNHGTIDGVSAVTADGVHTWQAFGTTSTFDIAFDVMRLHHDWSLPQRKRSPWVYYAGVDAVLLALLALVAARMASLGRPAAFSPPHRFGRIVPELLGEIVLPLAALLVVPRITTGLASPWEGWERLVFSVPDLGYAVLVLVLALLTVGIVRLGLVVRTWTSSPNARQEAAIAPPEPG